MANTKISALASQTAPVNGDLLVTVDVSDVSMGAGGTDKKITLSAIFDFLHPVGSYYSNGAVSTSPVTLFGSAGTWVAIEGKTIVGLDAAQTEFDTLGKTGGEKTHLLTGAESGEKGHGHSGTFASSYHDHTRIAGSTGWSSGGSPMSGPTSTASVNDVGASDASSAHNNLQPYEVAAIWRRTA